MTDNWSKWHSSGDISLISIYMMNFISWLGSSAVSLYKGKRPRSQPLRWSCTIETGSHQMDLFLSGRGVTTLTQEWLEWQFIDRFADYWHDWWWFLSSDTPVTKWHWDGIWISSQGSAPRPFPFIKGNDRGANPWDDLGNFQRGYPYYPESCHWMVFKPLLHNAERLK